MLVKADYAWHGESFIEKQVKSIRGDAAIKYQEKLAWLDKNPIVLPVLNHNKPLPIIGLQEINKQHDKRLNYRLFNANIRA
jgi:hypothetical protein